MLRLKGCQSFLPGSENAMIRLPVDTLVTMIRHVTGSGEKVRGAKWI